MPSRLAAIVTTFKAVLRVGIDLAAGVARSEVIEAGKGIYFGLTTGLDGKLLLAARNCDASGRISTPGIGTNLVHELDPRTGATAPLPLPPGLTDLHQIRRIGDFLGIVQGSGSAIVVVDLRRGRVTRRIDLLPFVPPELRHPADPFHPEDPYHFNSLSWDDRDGALTLLVLAHNWSHGSFALELACAMDADGPRPLHLLAAHAGLGRAAHDVLRADGTLHVLDSESGRLILRDAQATRLIDLPRHATASFARGLAVTDTHILVTYGFWSSEQFRRIRTPSRLCILDRTTLRVILDADLGTYGNTCEIMLNS
jgi:hypothetical protein